MEEKVKEKQDAYIAVVGSETDEEKRLMRQGTRLQKRKQREQLR